MLARVAILLALALTACALPFFSKDELEGQYDLASTPFSRKLMFLQTIRYSEQSSWEGNPPLYSRGTAAPIVDTADKFLDLIWQRPNMTKAQYEALKDSGAKPMIDYAKAPVIFALVGLAIGVLVLLTCPIFYISRSCCNCCGGSKHNPKGYNKCQVHTPKILLVVFCVIIIAFCGLSVSYNMKFDEAVQLLDEGQAGAFDDTISLLDNMTTFVDGTNTLINKTITDTVNQVKAVDVSAKFGGVTSLITQMVNALNGLATTLSSSSTLTTTVDNTVSNINPKLTQASNDASSVKTSIDNRRTVTINSQTYNINLPAATSLTNPLPDFSTAPSLSNIKTQLDNAGNFNTIATNVQTSYDNGMSQVRSTINSGANNVQQNLNTNDLTGALTDTKQKIKEQEVKILDTKADSQDAWEKYIVKYNKIRSPVLLSLLALVIFISCMSIMAAICNLRLLLKIFAPIVFFLIFLVWVLFAVHLIITAGLQDACRNKESLMDINVSGGNGVTINVKILVDNCALAKPIFWQKVNSQGTELNAVLGGSVSKYLGSTATFRSTLDLQSTFNSFSIPSFSLNTNADYSRVTALVYTELNSPAWNFDPALPYNTPQLKTDLEASKNALGPSTFNFDYTRDITNPLTTFNNAVTAANANYPLFTVTQIDTDYVQGGQTFDPAAITGSSGDSRNNDLTTKFNTVKDAISFNNSMWTEIGNLKTAITNIQNQITAFEAGSFAAATSDLTLIKNSVTTLKTNLPGFVTTVNTITSLPPLALGNITTAANNTFNTIKDTVYSVVDTSDGQFKALMFKYTQCRVVNQDVYYVRETACQPLLDSLRVLWFCFLLLGIFLIFALVVMIQGSKRFGRESWLRIHSASTALAIMPLPQQDLQLRKVKPKVTNAYN
eukprot:Colp12_sorted_trinity150504_noHs@29227